MRTIFDVLTEFEVDLTSEYEFEKQFTTSMQATCDLKRMS